MALINCPECVKEISDKAHICPRCGARLRPREPLISPLALFVMLITGVGSYIYLRYFK